MVSTGKKIGFGVGGLVIVAGATWALVATTSNHTSTTKAVDVGSFKGDYKNSKSAIKNGSLTVSYPGNASDPVSFAGYTEFAQWSAAQQQLNPAGSNTIFYVDKDGKLTNDGPAKVTVDKDAKTVTIKLRDDLKWSDGKDVTAQDVLFSLQTLATNKVASGNFTQAYTAIKGLSDYQNGKAKDISGVKLDDGKAGKQLTVSYTTLPAAVDWGDGVPVYALPYHDLKDVKSKDLATSEKVTKNPLSFGAFKVASVSSDSTVKYVKNSDYWGKTPKLNTITYYVNQDQTKLENDLSKQKFDIVTEAPASLWKDGTNNPVLSKYNNDKGYASTGYYNNNYWELYFNLGHLNSKTSENVQDRQTPLQDVNVRKAVGYAENVGDVVKKYGNGLSVTADTLVSKNESKKMFYNNSVKGYQQKSSGDIKKAGSLLEKSGYKKDSAGYYAKDGKRLSLVYLARSGNTTSEASAKAYIEAWKKAGIEVKLYQDKLVDPSTWQSIVVDGNNNNWDITDGGWSEGTVPTFDQLWSKSAPYNFGHAVSKELTQNLTDTQKATSESALIKNIKQFQKLVVDEQAYTIPTTTDIKVQLVNGRVTGWTTNFATQQNDLYAQLGVSQSKPVTSGNPRK
ncbi:ABC transporter substrate-binding protein [Leuconostoc gelidum]|uniref:ABC transporter substrate-binding protein n=1 Tax=Leuconostoc gelidum TaxID=1244 RepID=UPI001C7CEEDA|nr:ABC transporter substrate-binding protein [Leuconostoc gelidum]MBZ6010088.1 peptide-binding protein [Leuconostoc gelidum subsp. aenigmaticum]